MKRLSRSIVLLALLMPSCGGSSSPTGPTTAPTPAPIANKITASGSPTSGLSVAVTDCGGDCTSAVQLQIGITFNQAESSAQVYTQLMDAGGRVCAFNLSDSKAIAAGVAATFVTGVFAVQCDGQFTTTTARVTLFGPNPTDADVSARTGLLADSFVGGWTFLRPTKTPPAPSASCNGGSVPAFVSCGVPTAECKDGSFSCSQNRSGTCSSHNGVSCFICPGPLC